MKRALTLTDAEWQALDEHIQDCYGAYMRAVAVDDTDEIARAAAALDAAYEARKQAEARS